MGNKVEVRPGWSGALAFWAGSDHYSLPQAFRRAPFLLPVDRVTRIYQIDAKPLIGLGGGARFAVEYTSDTRNCFITLEALPLELEGRERTRIKPPGAALEFFKHSCKEPTALLLPLFIPMYTMLMLFCMGLWDEYILHNAEFLSFFANSGCGIGCVGQVLRIHSMVFFLFVVQLGLLLLPLMFLLVQAPRYRSALNYRMIQSYSLATILVGGVVFVQLIAFFPFRQYGKFIEMGFDPKVERLLSNLKTKK